MLCLASRAAERFCRLIDAMGTTLLAVGMGIRSDDRRAGGIGSDRACAPAGRQFGD